MMQFICINFLYFLLKKQNFKKRCFAIKKCIVLTMSLTSSTNYKKIFQIEFLIHHFKYFTKRIPVLCEEIYITK